MTSRTYKDFIINLESEEWIGKNLFDHGNYETQILRAVHANVKRNLLSEYKLLRHLGYIHVKKIVLDQLRYLSYIAGSCLPPDVRQEALRYIPIFRRLLNYIHNKEKRLKRHIAKQRRIIQKKRDEIFEELRDLSEVCNHCGTGKNLEIDHIIPVSKYGTSDIANLQLLCTVCNRRKGAKSL